MHVALQHQTLQLIFKSVLQRKHFSSPSISINVKDTQRMSHISKAISISKQSPIKVRLHMANVTKRLGM